MGIQLDVSWIIAGLFICSLLAYLFTKISKPLGAWVTVVASLAAFAVMFLLKNDIGTTYRLFFMEFKLTQLGLVLLDNHAGSFRVRIVLQYLLDEKNNTPCGI